MVHEFRGVGSWWVTLTVKKTIPTSVNISIQRQTFRTLYTLTKNRLGRWSIGYVHSIVTLPKTRIVQMAVTRTNSITIPSFFYFIFYLALILLIFLFITWKMKKNDYAELVKQLLRNPAQWRRNLKSSPLPRAYDPLASSHCPNPRSCSSATSWSE